MIFNGKSIYVGIQNKKRTTLALTPGNDDPEVCNHEIYEGPYSITPSMDTQTVDTDGKLMDEDITINNIPVTTVSNEYGETVKIG